jgi:hypothetical protein
MSDHHDYGDWRLLVRHRRNQPKITSSLFVCTVVFAVAVSSQSATWADSKSSTKLQAYLDGGSDKPTRISAGLVAQAPTPTPSYIPWYTAVPSPVPNAYAAIQDAFGAGNIYNSGGLYPGTGILENTSGACYFICYGAPGQQSHHMLAYGNDFETPGPMVTGSYTTQGAPDDCGLMCPGNISNQVFSITFHDSAPPNGGYFVSLDAKANLAVYNNIIAGGAVIAGAGDSTPEPSPSPGALIAYAGTNGSGGGEGELLLGSSADFVRCDYGETTNQDLTCNQRFVVNKGMQPNSASGAYAAETFPLGVAEVHPQILTGSCTGTAAGSVSCTFPNSFAFADTSYNCTVSAQGSAATPVSYTKTSTTSITIYYGTAENFSYICIR